MAKQTDEERKTKMREAARRRRARHKAARDSAAQAAALTPRTPNSSGRGGMPLGIQVTQDKLAKLLEYVRYGVEPEVACGSVGISFKTLEEWRSRAKDPTQHASYGEMIEAIAVAEGEAETNLVLRVFRDDPKWLLERRFKRRFTKVEKVEMTGANAGPIEINHGSPLDALKQRLDQMAERVVPIERAPPHLVS